MFFVRREYEKYGKLHKEWDPPYFLGAFVGAARHFPFSFGFETVLPLYSTSVAKTIASHWLVFSRQDWLYKRSWEWYREENLPVIGDGNLTFWSMEARKKRLKPAWVKIKLPAWPRRKKARKKRGCWQVMESKLLSSTPKHANSTRHKRGHKEESESNYFRIWQF